MTMERIDIRLFDLGSGPRLVGLDACVMDAETIRNRLRAVHRSVVALDFHGIEALTPSYFKKALLPIWTDPGPEREFFPVVANVRDGIDEDLAVSLGWCGLSTWEETLETRDTKSYAPFAKIDGSLFDTLSIIHELKHATAGSLADRYRQISSSAWSNRLAILYDRRMLARYKQGRQLIYTLPWLFDVVQAEQHSA
jgi:hypothetical protein